MLRNGICFKLSWQPQLDFETMAKLITVQLQEVLTYCQIFNACVFMKLSTE